MGGDGNWAAFAGLCLCCREPACPLSFLLTWFEKYVYSNASQFYIFLLTPLKGNTYVAKY